MTDLNSHTHTATDRPGNTTRPADEPRGPRGNTDLDKWHTRPFEFPKVDSNVEFETRFGVAHHGVIVRIAKPHPTKQLMTNDQSVVLFKSESVDPPEYYTVNQVEKWKPSHAYPMRRSRGACVLYADNDVSSLIVLFQAYILERYVDKFKPMFPSIAFHVRLGTIEAWTEVDGKSQWINQIGLPNSGVVLTHNEGYDVVDVTILSTNGETVKRSFNFKQVMEFSQLVCDLCTPRI